MATRGGRPAAAAVTAVRPGRGRQVHTIDLTAPDGARFTITRDTGRDAWRLSWADPQVWARPGDYQMTRYFCPGHGNSGLCPHGMHDAIHYTGPLAVPS
jgi:hypothetical protein